MIDLPDVELERVELGDRRAVERTPGGAWHFETTGKYGVRTTVRIPAADAELLLIHASQDTQARLAHPDTTEGDLDVLRLHLSVLNAALSHFDPPLRPTHD